ncbi:MAG: LD-carboxypeptidase [Bdellovibrionota bacterium]
MPQNKIPCLAPGDIIDIVAPGFAPRPEEVEGALSLLREWGYQPRMPGDLIEDHFLHANSDEKRFQFLKKALIAKDSRFIWCLRGGYGSNRLWPQLLKMKKPAQAKIIIGLSDITSLHHFVNQFWKWPSLHGAHLDRLGLRKSPANVVQELKDLLEGRSQKTEFAGLQPLNPQAQKLKKINSSVVGGNLVTLQSSIGTRTKIKLNKKILFVEEIGERAYRIDRVLVHLQQSGVLEKVESILFGEFFQCAEKDGSLLYLDVLKRFSSEVKVPVFMGLETGHGEIQRPLFFGTPAVLQGGESGKLIIDSGVKG